MTRFLTVPQAADRVGRSPRTIGRWVVGGLRVQAGYVREDELLEMDRLMRERRGRPRKPIEPQRQHAGEMMELLEMVAAAVESAGRELRAAEEAVRRYRDRGGASIEGVFRT